MARTKEAEEGQQETQQKLPLEIRVSKHALPRLDAYARDAKEYSDELRKLIPNFPPRFRFNTPLIETIRSDYIRAHNTSTLFSGLSSDLKKGRNVKVIVLQPDNKNFPPSIAMHLSSQWIGSLAWGTLERVVETLYPRSRSNNEIRKEPSQIRDALQSGRNVTLLPPRAKS